MPKQLPPGQAVRGPIHATPCPHCGKPNDWRHLQEQQLLDTGSTATCDHCGGNMQVAAVQPTVLITVRKAPPSSINRGVDAQPVQPARAVSQGFLAKLLGPGRKG